VINCLPQAVKTVLCPTGQLMSSAKLKAPWLRRISIQNLYTGLRKALALQVVNMRLHYAVIKLRRYTYRSSLAHHYLHCIQVSFAWQRPL